MRWRDGADGLGTVHLRLGRSHAAAVAVVAVTAASADTVTALLRLVELIVRGGHAVHPWEVAAAWVLGRVRCLSAALPPSGCVAIRPRSRLTLARSPRQNGRRNRAVDTTSHPASLPTRKTSAKRAGLVPLPSTADLPLVGAAAVATRRKRGMVAMRMRLTTRCPRSSWASRTRASTRGARTRVLPSPPNPSTAAHRPCPLTPTRILSRRPHSNRHSSRGNSSRGNSSRHHSSSSSSGQGTNRPHSSSRRRRRRMQAWRKGMGAIRPLSTPCRRSCRVSDLSPTAPRTAHPSSNSPRGSSPRRSSPCRSQAPVPRSRWAPHVHNRCPLLAEATTMPLPLCQPHTAALLPHTSRPQPPLFPTNRPWTTVLAPRPRATAKPLTWRRARLPPPRWAEQRTVPLLPHKDMGRGRRRNKVGTCRVGL